MKNIIIAIFVAFALGMGFMAWIKPAKTQTITITKTDTLRVAQHDTVKVIVVRHKATKTDTITNTVYEDDSLTINGYIAIINELANQTHTETIAPVPQSSGSNLNVGLIGGVSLGLKNKDIAPIIGMPIRYRHVYFMPFAEHNDELRLGAGVGITF